MAFNLQAGFGAGEGADMLQSILQQKAKEAFQNQQLAQEQQRIELARQDAQQRAAYQAEALRSLQEERQAREASDAQQGAIKATNLLKIGQSFNPGDQVAKALGPILGAVTESQPGQTLGSTNLSGAAGGPMATNANPGQTHGTLRYTGTPQQQETAKRESELQQLMNDPSIPAGVKQFLRIRSVVPEGAVPAELFKPTVPETQNVYERTPSGALKMVGTVPKGSSIANAPTPPQDHFSIQQVTGADGKAAFVRVNTQTGAVEPISLGTGVTAGKPNATLDTRLQSAEAATQTGNDIINSLHDPAVAQTIGPAMGRFNSAADFIGAPPPAYSELAGQIHSYALSQLGIHGMRSNQAAEQIRKDLSAIHTPEALEGYIKGLSKFSQHLLENNGRGPANTTPKVVKYDMDGNPIKD